MGSATGGVPVSIAHAFRNEPGWNVRCLVSMKNYIDYPTDLDWNRENLIHYWQQADVVHLHHGFMSADRMVKGRYVGRGLRHKPYVVEYHGTIFRNNARACIAELDSRNAIGAVSTLDLWLLAPDAVEWLPQPQDVNRLRQIRRENMPVPSQTIRICHAPTNRQVKSTDELLAAVQRLQDEGYPVELDLIEHRPWQECLERKAKADIYFDQVILGYGCNALEAWAMGIPVIAGAADETLDEMERRFGHLPFYHATEGTIYDALKELVEDPDLRQLYGKIGHDYVRKYHDEPVVVEQLKALYLKALGQTQEKAV